MHPRLIRAPGAYEIFGGATRVFVDDDGQNISYCIAAGSWGTCSRRNIDPRSGWFIHAANSTDVWIFDGCGGLMRLQWIEEQLSAQTTQTDPKLLGKAPKIVALHVRTAERVDEFER